MREIGAELRQMRERLLQATEHRVLRIDERAQLGRGAGRIEPHVELVDRDPAGVVDNLAQRRERLADQPVAEGSNVSIRASTSPAWDVNSVLVRNSPKLSIGCASEIHSVARASL
nr:hypothetical protein [Burkholderia contaminans]